MSNLVPTPIIDVNGRPTIVHRKTDITYNSDGRISSVVTTATFTPDDPDRHDWESGTFVLNKLTSMFEGNQDDRARDYLSEQFEYDDQDFAEFGDGLKDILTDNREDFKTDEVHYRMYLSKDNEAAVICVQDFDYHDYLPENFIGNHRFADENSAADGLSYIMDNILAY